jgi:hypothetical protein
MAAVLMPNFWAPQPRQAKTAPKNRDSTGHGTGMTGCHSAVMADLKELA